MTMTPSASLVIDELKFEIKNSDSTDKQKQRNRETETSKQTKNYYDE